MPTPRPFNAPTTFQPNISPMGEITRQVERMKALKTPAVKPQTFMQQMIDKIKNMPKPKVPGGAAITKAGSAIAGAAKTTATAVAGAATSPAAIATGLAVGLTSSEDQTMKWKRLGYPSKAAYDAVVNGKMTGQQVLDGEAIPGQLADVRGSETPGSSTPAKTNAGEGRAMDAADARSPGDGYPAGVVRPMDYETNPGKVQPNLNPGKDPGGSGGSEPRTTPEGLLSYGRDLSSLNQFTKDFTGGYELTDIKGSFQSEALPATVAGLTQLDKPFVPGASPTQKPNVSFTDEPLLPYGTQLPEGTQPFASTTPYKTGGNPSDPQDGTSDKPDRADRIRQVRTARLGRNGSRADFSGDEPDNSSLVSPMYANSKRNAIRAAFLDPKLSSVKASVAANAKANFGKDSDGRARFNYGGELVYAKDGMQQQAKNAAMMGQNPTEFLDIPATPEVKPDAPATSELSPAFTAEIPGANDFFRSKLKEVKDKNK